MRALKGIVREGKIELVEGATLPEGTVVTVTVGEAELIRASLAAALRRTSSRRTSRVPAYRVRVNRAL
ncbi:MAG: hypothetical protein WDA03_04115 [Trueperaceae bacterium]|jgi:hypothetical protein